MQQSCTYGSVRGAAGDRRPYRDASLASHRLRRGAPLPRRDDREYRAVLEGGRNAASGVSGRRDRTSTHEQKPPAVILTAAETRNP